MKSIDFVKKLCRENKLYGHVFEFGSRVVCDPPVMDTDDDVAVYLKPMVEKVRRPFVNAEGHLVYEEFEARSHEETEIFVDLLTKIGFKSCREQYEFGNGMFDSYKLDNMNVTLFFDEDIFEATAKATEVCKFLNIKDKETRVKLYEYFRYEDEPDGLIEPVQFDPLGV